MNRLILIGNGFDLAHGLKTSYNDFILWYIKSCFANAINNDYEDPLIDVKKDQLFYRSSQPFDSNTVDGLVQHYYEHGFQNILPPSISIGWDEKPNNEPFRVTIKSELLKVLLTNCSYTTWVEIETEFYELLKEMLKKDEAYSAKQQRISKLNESLDFVITKFKEYLSQLPAPRFDDRYVEIISSLLKKFEVLLPWSEGPQWRSEERFQIERTCVLNFNYTETVQQYVEIVTRGRYCEVINIHGQVYDEANPIIFGFGDELDDDYLKMERERAKGYFKFIKSFWYFRTSNYRNLVRFIDSGEYQIYILGHSCGLSDRTMLHMIFEHPDCRSIKIFYHGDDKKNNYTELTYEIARHFKDKGEMRKRIIPFDLSLPMPQATS